MNSTNDLLRTTRTMQLLRNRNRGLENEYIYIDKIYEHLQCVVSSWQLETILQPSFHTQIIVDSREREYTVVEMYEHLCVMSSSWNFDTIVEPSFHTDCRGL